jgi:hypothetical protein
VRRLTFAGLTYATPQCRHMPNRPALEEFLFHGVRYAFPARKGSFQRGVPTSHTAPALRQDSHSSLYTVWPSSHGTVVGESIEPLLPSAPELPDRNPELYALLTLVDGLRIGTVSERVRARRIFVNRLALTVA